MTEEYFIVPWQQITGEFTDRFVEIAKFVLYRLRQVGDFERVQKEASAKFGEDYERYKEKLLLLQHAGYKKREKIIYFGNIGWYKPYIEHGSLKFHTTAPPGRRAISLSTLLAVKRSVKEDETAIHFQQTKFLDSIEPLEPDVDYDDAFDDVFVAEA